MTRKLFQHFVYGSWWVALCASAMGMLTWFELTGTLWNLPLAIFIFGSTLVVYNLNMLSGLNDLRKMGTDSERHHWCMRHEGLMKLILAIGLFLAIVSIWFLNPACWLLLIPLGLVAGAYVVPIVRRKATGIRIREVGLWKIFMIAVVWAGMTAILPAVHLHGVDQINVLPTWHLGSERGIFILAITIPFDIRDLVNDAKKGVRTIPSTLGWKRSVWLAEGLLILFAGSVWMRTGSESLIFSSYLLSTTITMIAVGFASPRRNDMYCSFWIEGMMMVQFVSVVVFWATKELLVSS